MAKRTRNNETSRRSEASPRNTGDVEGRFISTDTRVDAPHSGPRDGELRREVEDAAVDEAEEFREIAGDAAILDDATMLEEEYAAVDAEELDEVEPVAEHEAFDAEAVELLRNQARQLAVHLRAKQEELDRREAEWQAQLALFDHDRRTTKAWLVERRLELADRETDLLKREEEIEARYVKLTETQAAAAELWNEVEAAHQARDEALQQIAAETDRRDREFDDRATQLAMEAGAAMAAQRAAMAEVEARREELQTEIAEVRREREEVAALRASFDADLAAAKAASTEEIEAIRTASLQQADTRRAAILVEVEQTVAAHYEMLERTKAEWHETVRTRDAEFEARRAELEQLALEQRDQLAAARAELELDALRRDEAFRERQLDVERALASEEQRLQTERAELERLASEPSEYQVKLQYELNEREAELERRASSVGEQEERMKTAMIELERLRAETEEMRERLAAQSRNDRLETAELRRRAEIELNERREALERHGEQLDFRRAAIRKQHDELAASQRETLEMRLASEELWTQLSGTVPAAALTEQMAKIRAKLTEQYRLAQNDLAAQAEELHSLRGDLAAESDRLRKQSHELRRWAEARSEEIEQQAAFLTHREAELERQDSDLLHRGQQWRQERFQLEQEVQRLQAELRRNGRELPPQPLLAERRRAVAM